MNIDLTNIIAKGTQFAEQASFEDRACNYELAAEAYPVASDCFMHAMKYGIMDEELRQNIHAKVENYVKRAEEIKSIVENEAMKKEIPVDNTASCERVRETLATDSKVTFDDVIGLANVKTALLEDVILPIRFSKLFQDKRQSSTFILLYGPPGTGKTHLVKSIAGECKIPFISVSSWMFNSKWHGHNEKYFQSLFELARKRHPCILLIDDFFENVFEERDDSDMESIHQHIRTELLIQMEGARTDNMNVFLLVVTNRPWTLDADIQRRFEKRIYIRLPDVNERAAMFKKHFDTGINCTINEDEWMQLAQKTEYYSGADIVVICRDAFYRPLRRLASATHFKRAPNPNSDGRHQLWFACSPEDPNAEMITIDKMESDELYIPPVTMSDILAALDTIKPSVTEVDMVKYRQFTEEFGEDGT